MCVYIYIDCIKVVLTDGGGRESEGGMKKKTRGAWEVRDSGILNPIVSPAL